MGGWPTVCLRMAGQTDRWIERMKAGGWGEEVRHFHQDYPAAENLIWESGPVLSEHTHTHKHTDAHCRMSSASPQFVQESFSFHQWFLQRVLPVVAQDGQKSVCTSVYILQTEEYICVQYVE